MYLKEISQVPLLTHTQELELGMRIERGKKAKATLSHNSHSLVSEAHLQDIISSGSSAQQHLVRANARLVISIAKRYLGRGLDFSDLIQEGNIGLMRAADKYDHHRGYKFSTYATWWIRQAITRGIADQGRIIRLPVHISDKVRKIYVTGRKLEQLLGRHPTKQEIADHLKVPLTQVEYLLKVSRYPGSLETPSDQEDPDSEDQYNFIPDENTPPPPEIAANNLLKEALSSLLENLSPREARILNLRFGLITGESMTLEEVAQKIGVTRERVRQIEAHALHRLRHPRYSRHIRSYLN